MGVDTVSPTGIFQFTRATSLLPFVNGNKLTIIRADVICGGADDLAVDSLLQDMRAPPGGAGDREQRGKHRRRDIHLVIGYGAVPVEVWKHLLGIPHYCFQSLGNVEEFHVPRAFRQLPGYFLDDLVARIGDGIYGVTEADDDLLRVDAPANIYLRLIWIVISLLNLKRDLIGAAVLRPTQGADRPGDAGEDIRPSARDDSSGEGGCIELVFCIKDQAGVHRMHPFLLWSVAMQQMQEMAA